ncbi:MAG: hypothetical protein ACLR23_10010 [Clostridia bacterium]
MESKKQFWNPPWIVTAPGKKHAWVSREWQGCPTIARTAREGYGPDGTAEVLSNRMKEITTFWYIVMMKDSPGVSRYW